jgi:exodeoxyribonuclease VII large subunit
VEALFPQGAGALELAFRQLCEKLRAEGLFEAARKRAIPKLPRHVALITSRTGDVLHDVLTTAWRRYAGLRVSLYPVRVQGDGAAGEICRAIELLNGHHARLSEGQIDLILLVRGGGSLEDLWAFNEEAVARAIVASRIPIGTGIGHEPDTTIADLVGDLRGPTPTGIAELTIPDTRGLCAELQSQGAILTRDMRRLVTQWETRLDRTAVALRSLGAESVAKRRAALEAQARKIAGIEPRHGIAQGWRRVEEAQRRLEHAAESRVAERHAALMRAAHRLERASPARGLPRLHDQVAHLEARLGAVMRARILGGVQKIAAVEGQLRVVSPQAVLERGFSITSDKEGKIVRSAEQVRRGDVITTRVADGEIQSTVGKPKQGTLF